MQVQGGLIGLKSDHAFIGVTEKECLISVFALESFVPVLSFSNLQEKKDLEEEWA